MFKSFRPATAATGTASHENSGTSGTGGPATAKAATGISHDAAAMISSPCIRFFIVGHLTMAAFRRSKTRQRFFFNNFRPATATTGTASQPKNGVSGSGGAPMAKAAAGTSHAAQAINVVCSSVFLIGHHHTICFIPKTILSPGNMRCRKNSGLVG
ncbi:MAG TPA: hypothetical protein PKV72_04545 [Candidatus Peribacteria bacterium]|nr:hypothetical protein [Candidatus Peribacteria bacterium]